MSTVTNLSQSWGDIIHLLHLLHSAPKQSKSGNHAYLGWFSRSCESTEKRRAPALQAGSHWFESRFAFQLPKRKWITFICVDKSPCSHLFWNAINAVKDTVTQLSHNCNKLSGIHCIYCINCIHSKILQIRQSCVFGLILLGLGNNQKITQI